MTDASFGTAVSRLWTNRDLYVPGFHAGIIARACFSRSARCTPLPRLAHVTAQTGLGCGARDLGKIFYSV